jgi:hypothetical protein
MTFSVFSESCQREERTNIHRWFLLRIQNDALPVLIFFSFIVSKMQQKRLSIILMLYLFIYYYFFLIYVLNSFSCFILFALPSMIFLRFIGEKWKKKNGLYRKQFTGGIIIIVWRENYSDFIHFTMLLQTKTAINVFFTVWL